MKCQVVLQLSASRVQGYDRLIELEETLMDGLTSPHELDNTDYGGALARLLQAAPPAQAVLAAPWVTDEIISAAPVSGSVVPFVYPHIETYSPEAFAKWLAYLEVKG